MTVEACSYILGASHPGEHFNLRAFVVLIGTSNIHSALDLRSDTSAVSGAEE